MSALNVWLTWWWFSAAVSSILSRISGRFSVINSPEAMMASVVCCLHPFVKVNKIFSHITFSLSSKKSSLTYITLKIICCWFLFDYSREHISFCLLHVFSHSPDKRQSICPYDLHTRLRSLQSNSTDTQHTHTHTLKISLHLAWLSDNTSQKSRPRYQSLIYKMLNHYKCKVRHATGKGSEQEIWNVNRSTLIAHPVWISSNGPVGTTEEKGKKI